MNALQQVIARGVSTFTFIEWFYIIILLLNFINKSNEILAPEAQVECSMQLAYN